MLIELGCPELVVAWQVARLADPPPLFLSHSVQGRAADRARQRLVAMGLIDPRGVIATDLHQAMSVFAQAPVEVDLRLVPTRGTEVRAALATLGEVAFLAVVTNGHVRFSRLPAEAGLAALVHVLPPETPARGTTISLPVADVDMAVTRSMEHGLADCGPGTGDTDDTLVAGLIARGVAGADARLFVSLVGSKRLRWTGFGITFRDRAGIRRRSSRTVRVVDMRRGRAVLHTNGEYLVAAPADGPTVVRVLTELRDAELGQLGGNRLG